MNVGVTRTDRETERSEVTALEGWSRTESPHQCQQEVSRKCPNPNCLSGMQTEPPRGPREPWDSLREQHTRARSVRFLPGDFLAMGHGCRGYFAKNVKTMTSTQWFPPGLGRLSRHK